MGNGLKPASARWYIVSRTLPKNERATATVVANVEVAVLLGGGIPLLPPGAPRTRLTLTKQRVYAKTGTVLLEYDVVRGKQPVSGRSAPARAPAGTARRAK